MEIFCGIVARGSRHGWQLKHLSHDDERIEIVFPFWIFRDGSTVTLLDTGFSPDRAPSRSAHDARDPSELLAEIGIATSDVQRIVLSHLHWDHFCNPERYPNAEFFVQRAEIDYFTGYGKSHPAAAVADAPSVAQIARLVNAQRFRALDGDARIFHGLKTYLVGGHTPGIQVTVVDGEEGPVVFACDTAHLYWNFEHRTPTPLINDYNAYMRGFEAIERLRGKNGVWFPGHDPKIIGQLRAVSERVLQLPTGVSR